MGSQFWWFYDTIAAAVVLLCIFLAGRKGIFKSMIAMMCFLIGTVISMSVSTSLAGSIQKNLVRPSNVKNISTALSEMEFNHNLEQYINDKYNILIDFKKLDDIYYKGEDIEGKMYQYLNAYTSGKVNSRERLSTDLREGYAQIISKAVGKYLNKYSAETAAKNIREGTDEDIYVLIKELQEPETRTKAAEFIADHYTAEPYKDIVRVVSFLLMFA
ncbi:MAG: hypothetical protein IJM44_07010, partial [Ruminococcus sp.]|nr:hypothetical protein [Ruminococcus sp.]